MGNWVETGDPLDALIEALSPIFGPVRAEKIAQTETTRAYAEGSIQAYEASGVVEEIEWLTVGDAEAEDCDICGPLDHKRVTIGEEFAPGITAPPGHVKCRCRIGAVIKRSVVAMIRRNLAVS